MNPRMKVCLIALLVLSLACEVQVNLTDEPPRPSPVVASPARAVAPSATRQVATTAAPSATLRPTLTPTRRVVFTPSMTRTPTDTAAPPLPDFPDVLTFGGGAGGGGECENAGLLVPDTVSLVYASVGKSAVFCTAVWRPTGGVIRLELISPAGPILDSPDIVFAPSTQNVEWVGYPGFGSWAQHTSDGTLYAYLQVWWPIDWPLGEWRAHVYGGQSVADQIFWVAKQAGAPYITAHDAREETSLIPAIAPPYTHAIRPNADGTVDVIGIDYPSTSKVFLLLYLLDSEHYLATLVQKLAVSSDNYGAVHARVSGPFQAGRDYVVLGFTDPNAQWVQGCSGQPCDYFRVMP